MNVISIVFEDICLSIDEKQILDHVNCTLKKGEITVLLGPNGSGKTSLFKCVKGLYPCDSGVIRYNSKRMQTIDGAIMVFDEPILYDELTGREHIQFISSVYGGKYDQAFINYLIEALDLLPHIDKLIASYSMGMKKKTQLICSLISSPEILLMDEFISGLDPSILYAVKKIMKEYVADDKYLLLSTHMLDMAEKFCDSVILMSDGKVVNDQTVRMEKILSDYTSLEEYYMHEMRHANHLSFLESKHNNRP